MRAVPAIITFLLSMAAFSAAAQSESSISGVAGIWNRSRGYFLDSSLTFYRALQEYPETYVFTPDHKIRWNKKAGKIYDVEWEKSRLRMVNGKLTEISLTLQVRGRITGEGWFWFIIQYRIEELSYPELKLQLDRVLKNKILPDEEYTWKDLIQD